MRNTHVSLGLGLAILMTSSLVRAAGPDTEGWDAGLHVGYSLTSGNSDNSLLNASLSLRVVVKDQYDDTPAEGQDKNDVSLLAGLNYKLW